jgi:hypothetical protein
MTGKSPRKKVDALHWQGRLRVAQAFLEAALRCPSNFAFQQAALMPPWSADRHAC